MDECYSSKQGALEALAAHKAQRGILIAVLAINAGMFAIEFTAGVLAGSVALMADAVDMLGDAMVYGLSIYALDRGARWHARAALAKGGFILLLGLGVAVQLVVKLQTGVPPSSTIMVVVGALALAANLVCLSLLWRFRKQDVNMSSTFECSRNDVIANCGVLVAAVGVAAVNAPWPDLLVGAIIAILLLRSAVSVLHDGWAAYRAADPRVKRTLFHTRRRANVSRRDDLCVGDCTATHAKGTA